MNVPAKQIPQMEDWEKLYMQEVIEKKLEGIELQIEACKQEILKQKNIILLAKLAEFKIKQKEKEIQRLKDKHKELTEQYYQYCN
jgi:hypothetical protein